MADDLTSSRVPLELAAELEGVNKDALSHRLKRGGVALKPDADDRRRKLVRVADLSPRAYKKYLEQQAAAALSPAPRAPSQPLLFEPTARERELTEALPLGVPKHLLPGVQDWAAILGMCNGTHRGFEGKILGGILVNNKADFLAGVANLYGVTVRQIRDKMRLQRKYRGDDAAFWRELLPKPRPGRSRHTYFDQPENAWAGPALLDFYLHQAKPSVRRSYELLCDEIDRKQREWGAGHLYEKPTEKQCRTYLAKIDLATRTLAREGDKAYDDRCAPFISRRPPEHANDVWVTDQRLCNVRLRDGGNRLGRVWVVNFLDVSTWRWLGCAFGPVLNSDMVMTAAAMALGRAGVPRAIQMDLGKEFRGKRFVGGEFIIRGETLFRDAVGLWERLSVLVVKAIGRNPQTKPIERWHRELDRFDQELPGWCGSDTNERPEKLAREEAAHHEWLQTGRGQSPLLGIPAYIELYLDFCERRWNAEHRGHGRYLQGMTPSETWNVRQHPNARTLTPEEVEIYTADHHALQVARGGQVNLTFHGQTIEYEAPELFTRQGEEVEVIVSRRSLRAVTVVYAVPGGTDSCVARRKRLHDWLPDDRAELREALRCRAALKRAVTRGVSASRALAAAPSLRELPAAAAELVPEVTASFASPGPRPDREISSSEWMMTRRAGQSGEMKFANDFAEEALADPEQLKEWGLDPAKYVEEMPEPAKPAPSLHDIGPVTVEDVLIKKAKE